MKIRLVVFHAYLELTQFREYNVLNVRPELLPRQDNNFVLFVLKVWYLTITNPPALIVQRASFLGLVWQHVNLVTLANSPTKVKVTVVIVMMEWFPMTNSQAVLNVKLVPTQKVEMQHAAHV